MNAAIPNRQTGTPWSPELIAQEHIDVRGNLKVPVADWAADAPTRPGWEPFWVNINLDRDPVKVFTYRRARHV